MRCQDLGFSSQSGMCWKVGGQFSAASGVELDNNKGLVWVADACFGTVIAVTPQQWPAPSWLQVPHDSPLNNEKSSAAILLYRDFFTIWG